MKPRHLSPLLFVVFSLGCPDEPGSNEDASTGAVDPASTSGGDTSSDRTSSADSTSAETSADTDGPSAQCPLEGDLALEIDLGAGDFTPETLDLGAGSFQWSLVATPAATLPAFGPGDEVVVTLRFDAPLAMTRDGRELSVSITADGDGTTRASATPETITASTGELQPGPWQTSLSTNAGGAPIRLALSGITINPNTGETLGCFSVRAQIPAQANSVEDSSLLDIVAGSDLAISEVRVSATGDGLADPFALSFE